MERNGEQWAIPNKLDSKIERERERKTEFLFNMLSLLSSLINDKAKVSMASSESLCCHSSVHYE